jgi:hypothetical protein
VLDRQAIENCLVFLNRSYVSGSEVPAFNDVVNRLNHLRNARIAEEDTPPQTESPTPE